MTEDLYKKINDYNQRYDNCKTSLGKALIGAGILDLGLAAIIYTPNEPNSSTQFGIAVGLGAIAYGIKTLKNGNKIIDKLVKKELGYNLEQRIQKK